MNISFLSVGLHLGTKPNLESSRLVVGTVRAGNQLFILALEGKPGFQVIFLSRGIVERTRNYSNNLVWQSETLVELL